MSNSQSTSSQPDNAKPQQPAGAKPVTKMAVADVLPAADGAKTSAPTSSPTPATTPPATTPPSKTLNEQAGDAEEKDGGIMGGLGKLAKNSMSPYLLMAALAAASLMGAPMWMIVAGGLVGWAMIAAGRNGGEKPHGNGDVALMPPPSQGQVLAQGRGQAIDVELTNVGGTNLDVQLVAPPPAAPTGNLAGTSLDVALQTPAAATTPPAPCATSPQSPTPAAPAPATLPIVPKLNGVQCDNANNNIILPPSPPPAAGLFQLRDKQNCYGNGF